MLVVVEAVVVVGEAAFVPVRVRELGRSRVPMVERHRGLLALRLGGDGILPARPVGLHGVAERCGGDLLRVVVVVIVVVAGVAAVVIARAAIAAVAVVVVAAVAAVTAVAAVPAVAVVTAVAAAATKFMVDALDAVMATVSTPAMVVTPVPDAVSNVMF